MATTEVKPSADKNPNLSLGPKKDLKKKKKKIKKPKPLTFDKNDGDEQPDSQPVSASEQLTFFLNQLESAIGVRVSSLELDPIKDKCIVELSQNLDQNVSNLGEHLKMSYGSSWRESLCEGETIEGKVDPGNPSVLVISSSALRSLELQREGLRLLTEQCPAVKLFSKHLKVEEQDLGSDDKIYQYFHRHFAMLNKNICTILESDDKIIDYVIGICNAEQHICTALEMMIRHIDIFRGICYAEQKYLHVSLLKKRVNIGSGTPSRIKKLIDIEALGLSRLDMIVLDMHTDVKGFSLFTLPQVRDEFWDLYKNCFHQRVLEGNLRICLYGPKPAAPKLKNKKKQRRNQH